MSPGASPRREPRALPCFAEKWVERYQGTGWRGFCESTREDYRRLLRDFAFPFFDEGRWRRLADVTPADVADFSWLCDSKEMADLEYERARANGKPARSASAASARSPMPRSATC